MLESWNRNIFSHIKDRLQTAAMQLVLAERNGEAFDSQMVVGVRESYGKNRLPYSVVTNGSIFTKCFASYLVKINNVAYKENRFALSQ